MRRGLLATVVCVAGLAAGCGSTSRSATSSRAARPVSPAISALTQTSETIGASASGTRYDAVNHGFLGRLATILGRALESRGLHDVNVTCSASVSTRATCQVTGVSGGGQSTSGTLRVRIDRRTGELRLSVK